MQEDLCTSLPPTLNIPPTIIRNHKTDYVTHIRFAQTPLIDRDAEVASVVSLLQQEDIRLVTLTGPGGVGKTRVALAVASSLANDLQRRVSFVELAAVRDSPTVLSTIAESLGLILGQQPDPVEQLAQIIRSDRLILVLDNMEQVVESATSLADLLLACPGLKVLVTSRVVLRLSLEYDVPIAPLSMPDAMRLFVSHVQRTTPSFSLSAENAPVIEAICSRLDRLPLAIELAAARVSALPTGALLARLDRALPLLTAGSRDQPARLQTMRGAIAWSHDLLSSDEQVLFRRLAVFSGGFTLDAAEEVCARVRGDERDTMGEAFVDHCLPTMSSVLDGIASLIDKSLVSLVGGPEERDPRYRMLETIREFGLEQLESGGEERSIRAAHAEFYCDQAFRLCEQVWGDTSIDGLARQDAEHDNVRAALEWAKSTGDADLGLRLAGAMTNFWIFRGHYREGHQWFAHWVNHIAEQPTSTRAIALARFGWLAVLQGDVETAHTTLLQALADARTAHVQWPEALALLVLGFADMQRGDYVSAVAWTARSLELFHALEDEGGEAPYFVSIAEAHLGLIHLAQNDLGSAKALLDHALVRQREQGFLWGLGDSLCRLGHVARRLGNREQAVAYYHESINLGQAHGDPRMLAESIAGLAIVAAASGDVDHAARLFGMVSALRSHTTTLVKGWAPVDYELGITMVREALPPDAFEYCWSEGEQMLILEGVMAAVAASSSTTGGGTSDDAVATTEPTFLTPREAEVLRLLAKGLTDREIADAMFLSHRTIGGYVTKILTKFDLESRTAAAVYAVRHGLA